MGKNKRGIYWTMMGAFMALIVMICGVTLVESAKVATFHAEQTVTYNVPEYIDVTLYADGGRFNNNSDTLTGNLHLKFNTVSQFETPAKTGYSFAGWKYSVDNNSWSNSVITENTDFPFTDHLYLKAQWSVSTYTLSYNLNSGTHGSSHPDGASYNTSFTVSNPTRSGYDFIGWNITGMDSVTHTYGGSTTTSTSISGTTATTFNNLRSTSGTVTFTATWAQKLTVPTQNGTLTYSGSAQSPSWNNYDDSKMALSGVSSGTNAGNYSARFSLIDKTNYHWSDGTTDDKTVTWSIGQLAGSISYGVTALNKNVGDSAFTNLLTNTGDGAVSYSISCNPSEVASINSSTGEVTLGSVAGTATVTATVSNSDNTTYATKTASYTITLETITCTTPSYFNYAVVTGGVAITGLSDAGKSANLTDIILPSQDPDGRTVVALNNDGSTRNGSATNCYPGVTSVVIPSSVTSIGDYAFENATSIVSVTIPSSVVSIGEGAFGWNSTSGAWNLEINYDGTWSDFANMIVLGNYNSAVALTDWINRNRQGYGWGYDGYDNFTVGTATIITNDDTRNLSKCMIMCFTADTDVMVYDEKRKRIVKKKIKDVTYRDILVVWNFDEGKLDYAKPLWIKKPTKVGSLHKLTFSDGSVLEILGYAHYIYSATKQRFVNACDLLELRLGDEVFTVDGRTISLVSHEVIKEKFDSYSVITDYHMNIFTNGILTSLPYNNIYEIKDMKFVKEARTLRTIKDYDDIPENYFDGLRLAEQVADEEAYIEFINSLLKNQKEEK